MSRVCQIVSWNKCYIGFTLQVSNPRRAQQRLATLGFLRVHPKVYTLANTRCIFKDEHVLVQTHQDNVAKMYRLLVK
jgi:hypothetical protein